MLYLAVVLHCETKKHQIVFFIHTKVYRAVVRHIIKALTWKFAEYYSKSVT